MSLTGLISDRSSPVRGFFDRNLFNSGAVVREAATMLRGALVEAPLRAAPEVNPGRAGTAVDYLIRFALAEEPCRPHSAGISGAGMLGSAEVSFRAIDAVRDALAHVAEIAAYRRPVSAAQWEELTRVSLLLASFEAVFRSGGLPPSYLDAVQDAPPVTWQEWAAVACSEVEVEDVAVLGWATVRDHDDLLGRAMRCNPTFAQSVALGGADADLLTDGGLLIDFKSTSTRSVCSTRDIWQVCGYALADTDDELGITAVGISALRWRSRVHWPLVDLLSELAGGAVDLARMRQEFAESLG